MYNNLHIVYAPCGMQTRHIIDDKYSTQDKFISYF